jgi:hypothetical protein
VPPSSVCRAMVLWRGHPQALKFETEVEGYLHLLDKELKERSVEERAREAEEEEEEREEDGEQGVGKVSRCVLLILSLLCHSTNFCCQCATRLSSSLGRAYDPAS